MWSKKNILLNLLTMFTTIGLMHSIVLADANLKSKVVNELSSYYQKKFSISVKEPGVVTIKGSVPSYWDKLNVFSIVEHVPGVTEISNELVVETDLLPDDEIKANIEHELERNHVIIEPYRIKVVVDDGGLVILRGKVSMAKEANMALDIASWQKGVKSVVNEIEVLPPEEAVSDTNISTIITNILERDFPLEKDAIYATVDNGSVFLTGEVNRMWARHSIEKEIQKVRGVTTIQNDIKVKSKELVAK